MKLVSLFLSAALSLLPLLAPAAGTDAILDTSQQKISDNQDSQQRIEKVATDTDRLLEQYRDLLEQIDTLKTYNAQLQSQIANQKQQLQHMDESLLNISDIERQIGPITVRMIDSLEQFIALDVPFRLDERQQRVTFLRDNVDRPDITAAEKFRQVLDAYLIETGYGHNIDTYNDTVTIEGEEREAYILRIGRIALLYQTPDKAYSGYWDNTLHQWVAMDDGEFRQSLIHGLRVARQQATMDLLSVPVTAPVRVTDTGGAAQ